MSHIRSLTRDQVAARVARDIQDGWYVNLGIGAPERVTHFIAADLDVILHSENGILGMGRLPSQDAADPDLINAGKKPVTLVPGGAFFDHMASFSMMRGGHLDLCLLGAFQVSQRGDLANWWTGDPEELPAVGGAMDLVAGARRVFVMMDHVTKSGGPKLVRECSYPLTGLQVVNRVYTDLAVLDVSAQGFIVTDIVEGLDWSGLQDLTDAPLQPSDVIRQMRADDF